jgi:DnaK suppressor protein
MNAIDAHARDALLNRRRAILRLLTKNSADERTLREGIEPDWPDRALSAEIGTILERLTDRERAELTQIDAALKRISSGSYGQCEVCRGPIGRQRLRAIPEARYCVGCSEAAARLA